MRCPICGARCVCRNRGPDGRCCSCHKHKARTPQQARAHRDYERLQRDFPERLERREQERPL